MSTNFCYKSSIHRRLTPDFLVHRATIKPKFKTRKAKHQNHIQLDIYLNIIFPKVSNFGDKYTKGLVEEKGRKLITTTGIGTSILPVRFNCIPEIVVIKFE